MENNVTKPEERKPSREEIYEKISKQIFDYQCKNGFQTFFDFLLEDISELKGSVEPTDEEIEQWAHEFASSDWQDFARRCFIQGVKKMRDHKTKTV